MTLKIADKAGDFAGNKDTAGQLREEVLLPELKKGHEVVLDFTGVDLATQSFVHALVSDLIRRDDLSALDYLVFANCNEEVQRIVEIVVDYSQDDVPATESG